MSPRQLSSTLSVLAIILAFSPTQMLPAETTGTRPTSVDPQARQIISSVFEKYASLNTYRHQEKLTLTVTRNGKKHKQSFLKTLVFEKPNKFLLREPNIMAASDGLHLRVYYPSLLQYTDSTAPRHGSVEPFKRAMLKEDLGLVLTALMAKDGQTEFLPRFGKITYLGQDNRAGNKFHKLALHATYATGTLVIGAEDLLVAELTVQPVGEKWHLLTEYQNVTVNQAVNQDRFKINVAKEARKVDRISFTRRDDYRFLNKSLPKTWLAQLNPNKGKIRPDKLLGKINFVTFWASWCRPCLIELPQLQKLYNKYHGRGFNVVAINTDTKDNYLAAKRFVKRARLSFPILLDPRGRLARSLEVSALPTMLVIDGTGRIVEAHMGVSPRAEFEFVEIIERGLADKKK